ncbi:hypothetical protein [Aequorivita lipolytica]|uniref:Uncharacterized protein n=1 Tax=Aequorivita lipolytica TaxID=153267 RepID=A0A5C6YMF3_9FLAO|nr:hypothetical protein [Aequorivita lipolytica]TXD68449.1 hypothetical protein ESV24_12280 [Aequorivita lipolytica]
MKKLVAIVLLFISFSAFSQDPYLQKSNATAKEEAVKITDNYNLELSLTGEQQLLFQQKVEEFLIRRYKVESELKGREKLTVLYQLQNEETKEMNNILTRPQLEVYKQVKPNIQPLERVSKE